jgi:hypothetical protein
VVIELAQQVSERLDLPTSETHDRRQEQTVRRDGHEPAHSWRLTGSL